MSTAHGGAEGHHSHGGSGGLGWNLLDSIMLAASIALACLLVELLIQARRERVRYNLTPQGQAAASRPGDPYPASGPGKGTPPVIDTDELDKA